MAIVWTVTALPSAFFKTKIPLSNGVLVWLECNQAEGKTEWVPLRNSSLHFQFYKRAKTIRASMTVELVKRHLLPWGPMRKNPVNMSSTRYFFPLRRIFACSTLLCKMSCINNWNFLWYWCNQAKSITEIWIECTWMLFSILSNIMHDIDEFLSG